MSDTTTEPAARRIFIDKRSPQPYRALLQTAEAVHAAAADAGLERTLMELINLRVSQINAFNRVSIMSGHPVRGSSR